MTKTTLELSNLRNQIDEIDHELLMQLALRQEQVKKIGQLKKFLQIQVHQPQRWQQVMERNLADGNQLGLSSSLIAEIWEKIHQEALRIEQFESEKI